MPCEGWMRGAEGGSDRIIVQIIIRSGISQNCFVCGVGDMEMDIVM